MTVLKDFLRWKYFGVYKYIVHFNLSNWIKTKNIVIKRPHSNVLLTYYILCNIYILTSFCVA